MNDSQATMGSGCFYASNTNFFLCICTWGSSTSIQWITAHYYLQYETRWKAGKKTILDFFDVESLIKNEKYYTSESPYVFTSHLTESPRLFIKQSRQYHTARGRVKLLRLNNYLYTCKFVSVQPFILRVCFYYLSFKQWPLHT